MAQVDVPADKALSTLADYTKWLTGLATAGLAFSIGLQQNIASYHAFTRWSVVVAWGLYAIAVLAGVLLQSSFPTRYEKKNYSIRDVWMVGTYLTGLGALVVGSFSVFLALFSLTWMLPDPGTLSVKNANAAVVRAKGAVKDRHVGSVDTIELLKGADMVDVTEEEWHVRFTTPKSTKDEPDVKVDVFVNAATGATTVIAPPKPILSVQHTMNTGPHHSRSPH
ncbi:MAG TPA: hypothetical protein VGU66_09025 [Candidatus Elarobacter sp.]|nr:hypothetical protein [Candidatus Elarobacter sp.]